MERKIYVTGIADESDEEKLYTAISTIQGVTFCKVFAAKAQVLVQFDESIAGIEETIEKKISETGFEAVG